MLILDIETEENLQCGITSGGGASGGGGGGASSAASSKKASASAAGAVIKELQGQGQAAGARVKAAGAVIKAEQAAGVAEKAAATATNTANARRNASLNTSRVAFTQAVTGKSKSQVKREAKARKTANK